MKTGLALSCLVFGISLPLAVFAADPEPAVAPASEPAERTGTPPEQKTSSERAASTRDGDASKQDAGGSEVADEDYGHGMQFGLRAGLSGGYRMVFRYDKSPFCHSPDMSKVDKDQQKFCGHGAPLAVDLALSFAPLDFVEPYAWVRFGLGGEAETNTESVLAFGAGARIYTMSDSKFKIYVEPAVGMEVESGAGNEDWKFQDGTSPEYKNDFLFHLAVGGQYDFARAFGAYLSAGMTTGMLRYIHTSLELSGGVQVRVP